MYLFITVIIGVCIGIQTAISSFLGTRMNPLLVGLTAMLIGGSISLLLLTLRPGSFSTLYQAMSLTFILTITVSGVIGIIAIGGSALVLPKVGLTTGAALVILGQMLVTLGVDAWGIAGKQIAISPQRIFGIILIIVAVWLIKAFD